MKKLSYFTTIILAICLFAIPTSGLAKVTLMTDSELEQITAQAGFSDMLGIFQINHDDETGSYYFGSDNGGYVSLADITYDGSIDIDSAVTSTTVFANNGTTGVECVLDGNIIDISNFSTTVRLGSEIGAGKSLGTLHIGRMVVGTHGIVRITTN